VGNGPTGASDPSGLARNWLKIMTTVKCYANGTAEFVLKNGKRIRIRNAKFINSWVSLADIAAFTNVKMQTIRAVREKLPDVKIFFNKLGQPIFTRYAKATVPLSELKAGTYVAGYGDKAWAWLKLRKPEKFKELYPKKHLYVWHHAADGSLQLIDKDLHTAFQHTGLNSVLKRQLTAVALLIPGTEQFKKGDVNGGTREVVIAFTPIVWSEMLAEGLGAFYDECRRELYEDKSRPLGLGRPPSAQNIEAVRRRFRKAGVEPPF